MRFGPVCRRRWHRNGLGTRIPRRARWLGRRFLPMSRWPGRRNLRRRRVIRSFRRLWRLRLGLRRLDGTSRLLDRGRGGRPHFKTRPDPVRKRIPGHTAGDQRRTRIDRHAKK